MKILFQNALVNQPHQSFPYFLVTESFMKIMWPDVFFPEKNGDFKKPGMKNPPKGCVFFYHHFQVTLVRYPYHPWDWYIYLRGYVFLLIFMVNVGRYTRHGYYGVYYILQPNILNWIDLVQTRCARCGDITPGLLNDLCIKEAINHLQEIVSWLNKKYIWVDHSQGARLYRPVFYQMDWPCCGFYEEPQFFHVKT